MRILIHRTKITPWDIEPVEATKNKIVLSESSRPSSHYAAFIKYDKKQRSFLDFIFGSYFARALGFLLGFSIDCNPFSFYKKITENPPDIIYTTEDFTLSSCITALFKKKESKFIFMRWENKYKPPFNPIRKIVMERSNAIIVPIKSTKLLIQDEFPQYSNKVFVIPGIVDTRRFNTKPNVILRSKLNLDNKFVILFVGSLIKRKGINYLILAFNKLHSKYPNTSLVLSGNGNDEREFKDLVSKLNLDKEVIFLGPSNYKNMHEIFPICDVFCLPSTETSRWKEQFGFVIIQAMACGKPIVGSNSGSIPEVIGDAGVIVPERNSKLLANAFEKFILSRNYTQRLGKIARRRAEEVYALPIISKKLEELFEKVMKNNSNEK